MDRNGFGAKLVHSFLSSLSARRAWIEIMDDLEPSKTRKSLSARRAWIEITGGLRVVIYFIMSLSARRAWIEISRAASFQHRSHVALRKESVDRNGMEINGVSYDVWSLSARRAWIEIIKKGRARRPGQSRSPQGERG